MLQIGGIHNAPIGKLLGIPTLALSDTENEKWGNRISFPLSKHVFSPDCFNLDMGGSWKNQITYPSYHELSYLTPLKIGEVKKPKNRFLIRFVEWQAGHDIGETSLSVSQKITIVNILNEYGRCYISSEGALPRELKEYAWTSHASGIHKFMKDCKLIIGESATMASEAACMGIPAIFISNTGRGYTTEQDQKYGLIKHFKLDQWKEILNTVHYWASTDMYEEWQLKRKKMLKDKIDVTAWMVDVIENYPRNIDSTNRRYKIDYSQNNK